MSNLSFPLIPRARNTPAAKIATNTTVGKSGLMPGKFGVASNGSMFSNARKVYNADAGGGQNYHPSSSYTYLKKITAIGKSSSVVPVRPSNNKQQLAFAGGNRNVVNSALRKARGGGAAYRSKNYSQFKYGSVPHAYNKPVSGTPGSGTPGSGTPGSGTPGSGTPGSGTPGSGTPGLGTPGSGTPGSGTPGLGTPGSGTPGSGTPGSGTPGSGTPGSGTPGLGTPGSGTTSLKTLLDNLITSLKTKGDVSAGNANEVIEIIQQNTGFKVFATPTYEKSTSNLEAQSPISVLGKFDQVYFKTAYEITQSSGFTNSALNGKPWYAFAAYAANEFKGIAVLFYHEPYYKTPHGSAVQSFFYQGHVRRSDIPSRKIYPLVMDANGTTRESTLLGTETFFSYYAIPEYPGYYKTDSFSYLDGIWGFSIGQIVDGYRDSESNKLANGQQVLLSANPDDSYGVQETGKTGTWSTFYWGGLENTNNWALYCFTQSGTQTIPTTIDSGTQITSGSSPGNKVYRKTWNGVSIFNNGTLYTITAAIPESSFKIRRGQGDLIPIWDTDRVNTKVNPITIDLHMVGNTGNDAEEFFCCDVNFTFDPPLSEDTGVIYLDLETADGKATRGSTDRNGSAKSGKITFAMSHVGPPQYIDSGPRIGEDAAVKLKLEMLSKDKRKGTILEDTIDLDVLVQWRKLL